METLLKILSVVFFVSSGIFLWRLIFRRHLPKKKWFIISLITLFIFGYFEDKHDEKQAIIKEKEIIAEEAAKQEREETIVNNKENWSNRNEVREKLYNAKIALNLKDGCIFDTIENVSNYNHQFIGFFKTEIPYDQIFRENNLIYDYSTNKPANGIITLRDRLGEIYYKQNVKDGKKHGEYKEYYSNHNIKIEGSYSDNEKTNRWKTYYNNKKNQLQRSVNYENKLFNGSYISFYDNGNTETRGEYLDGIQVGEWELYHSNGNLDVIGTFKNGKKEGKWKFYHPNGELAGIGKMSEDNKIETWKYYYSNGDLKEKVRYTLLGLRLKY